jgi:hypothetical protein
MKIKKEFRHSGQRFLLSLRGPPDPGISTIYWIPRGIAWRQGPGYRVARLVD